MHTNLTTSSPSSLQILCLFKDIARNSTSAYYAVNLSASVIIALLAPLAVTGNALILMAIWRNQSLRTPSYIILCALAFTDLCTGLITQPFHVAAELICLGKPQENSRQLPFLLFARFISEACGTYFLSLTTALITLMSIERWLHMARRSLLTVRRSCLIMAVMSLLLIPVVVFRLLYDCLKKPIGLSLMQIYLSFYYSALLPHRSLILRFSKLFVAIRDNFKQTDHVKTMVNRQSILRNSRKLCFPSCIF